ncbi:hypothetical protein [Jidongwangia harbinensis]|uniref:hypothetical protein n=1 Tax=Jidongwangia harbinensis TaxID=2878561 RepID=UPI001CD9A733|nr:hypothetical protein [Jidongwangia harbinensis]MCA2213983.1 hypothetical protein [Jidongwangia harbinensis]
MSAGTSMITAVALAATPVTWVTANSVATGDQDGPAVAANRTGHVAVVWQDDRDGTAPGDDTHSEIYLRLFRNGAPVHERKLSAGGTGGAKWRHVTPDVGLDDRGNAVVVWADDPDGNGVFNVPYRVVSPTGAVLASGRANADSAGNQIRPRVAVDPDGTPGDAAAVAFTVVWEDVQGTALRVRAAGWTGATRKVYEVTASQTTGAHQRPDVGVSAAGDATVVWEEDAGGDGSDDIGLTRLARANGAVTLSRRTGNAIAGGTQGRPAVAVNVAGDAVLAWESGHPGGAGVWARSFTAAGTARHAEVPVSTGAGARQPSAGLDDQGEAVVGWTVAGADGWVRGLNPDGSGTGRLPAQLTARNAAGRQDELVVAVSPWGEIAVGYTDDADGNLMDQVVLGVGATNDAATGTALTDPALLV